MEETEKKESKQKELTLPMAIVLGAFIIAIAILVVMMPRNINGSQQKTNNGSNTLDSSTITTMVNHILATKNSNPVIPVNANDHIQGSSKPIVTIIEYSDLECPFCKNFDVTMNQIMQKYSNKVAWVYRHFPLDCVDDTNPSCTPLHPKARHEAVASECAFEQGGNDAFWKYITEIFKITPSNNGLDPQDLGLVAQDLGLDMNKFNTCLSSDKYANVVSVDAKEGLKSNVEGTPMSIIIDKMGNTYTVSGAFPYEVIAGAIDKLSQ